MAKAPTIGRNPRDQIIGATASKVAPLLGLKAATVTLALTTAIGIGTTIHQNITRFDKGYEAAIADLKQGSVELDDEVIEIKTEADKKALESWQSAIDAKDDYETKDDEAVKVLEGQVTYYKRRLSQAIKDRKDEPKIPPNCEPLPTHERVRFEHLNRERDSDGSAEPRAAIDNRPELVGYPAPAKP